MCLVVSENKVNKADKEIICYKIMRIRIQEDRTVIYETPLQCEVVDKKIISGKKPFIATIREKQLKEKHIISKKSFCSLLEPGKREIDVGAIHSYHYEKEALRDLKLFVKLWGLGKNESYAIFKCVIPKDTLYYVGEFGSKIISYASRQLVFKEELSVY